MKRGKGKGKEREMQDEDFDKERTWLLLGDTPASKGVPAAAESLQDHAPGGSGASAAELNALPKDEGGLECGCCFSPAPFVYISYLNHPEPIN